MTHKRSLSRVHHQMSLQVGWLDEHFLAVRTTTLWQVTTSFFPSHVRLLHAGRQGGHIDAEVLCGVCSMGTFAVIIVGWWGTAGIFRLLGCGPISQNKKSRNYSHMPTLSFHK